MTVADVDICNRALIAIGSRNKITSLSDDTEEGQTCNMLYAQLRDQILGMAPWNFARKTATLNLVKAAPGTPASPVTNASQWISAYPAPPWMYEYVYPSDCLQLRYVVPQPGIYDIGLPIFPTAQYTYEGILGAPPQQFVVTTDIVGPVKAITNITQANPGVVTSASHGFTNGDIVYLFNIIGMTELNGTQATVAGATTNTYQLSGVNTSAYTAYSSGGVAVNQTQTGTQQNVILTDAMGALGVYTQQVTNLDLWGAQAIQAFVSAMAATIGMTLTGDKNLVNMLFGVANKSILDARATDGNEGLTIQNSMPDWIAARGITYNSLGPPYIAPYPPLFAVS
jgi:hypothetical protein